MHDMKPTSVNGASTLVLLLHAYTQTPRHMAAVRAAVAHEWPEARLVCPELPLSLLSVADPNEIVAGLLDTIELEVVPGIPALCAAAALLGAPLMHDFASISLSDLLTPLPTIMKRVRCAVEGDFVLVLYNPKSRKRDSYLGQALAIAAEHRGPDTPVGFVRNAYRPDQDVRVATLGTCDPEWADMLTTVVIGNSASRLAGGKILTPRGYFEKYG